ncbi:MAG: Restriction endonuclease subunit S [Sporanaerobacter sp.]|jgi:type I restriction enzyme, S subunit|uniref:restriction endonuclease subunit S n=1 Tax=Sporanaerobacter sp. TaxID=2010183 RepID=UPI003A101B2C
MKWPIYKINDICKVSGGKRLPKGHQFVDSKTKHPYIRITDMSFDSLSTDGLLYITEETFKHISRYTISKDDIYISIAGTIGYVGKIPEFIDGANLTENCAKLSEFSDEINRDYLLYYLRSPRGNGELLVRKGGASQPKLALERIKTVPVPVPPINIQSRIANILSAYDDLIQNNQKQIKLLEEAAMRLYTEWFVNLRFPGHENTKIVDGVPEGWRLGRVSELAEFKRGKTITKKNAKDGNVPVVAGGLEPAYFHNVANTVAPVITISASGANAGYTRLYNTDIWASDCSYIDASYGDKLYFIYTFLKNNKEVIDNLQRGAAQPHVYAKDINALSTYIPESTIMEPFCNLVAPLFKKIAVQERLISELKQARDKLLPKLMSGEIEV